MRLLTGIVLAALAVTGLPILRTALGRGVDIARAEVAVSVDRQQLVELPIAASHVVVRWSGAPDATITLALGRSPDVLSEEIPIEPDDFSEPGDPEVFSDVIWADGARYARISTDRPIEHLTVVALDTDESKGIDQAGVVDAAVNAPAVITRAGWGANESYSVNSGGYIRYAHRFQPLQKLIVHHTAGRNNDPNPAATIRAIFYDHAVLRGYGDIDYNYLIDAQGRVYEGRRAWNDTPLAHPTEEDFAGNVVGGSHARNYNEATVGIVLLGNFTSVLPTSAARTSLVNLLAWKAERHGIDPLGGSTYHNPVNSTVKWLYNISGHRNVNSTACPGQAFYDTFPQLRQQVANRIAATTGPAHDTTPPAVIGLEPMVPNPTGAHTLRFGLIFREPVTDLAPRTSRSPAIPRLDRGRGDRHGLHVHRHRRRRRERQGAGRRNGGSHARCRRGDRPCRAGRSSRGSHGNRDLRCRVGTAGRRPLCGADTHVDRAVRNQLRGLHAIQRARDRVRPRRRGAGWHVPGEPLPGSSIGGSARTRTTTSPCTTRTRQTARSPSRSQTRASWTSPAIPAPARTSSSAPSTTPRRRRAHRPPPCERTPP
jgi:hypothetical protein